MDAFKSWALRCKSELRRRFLELGVCIPGLKVERRLNCDPFFVKMQVRYRGKLVQGVWVIGQRVVMIYLCVLYTKPLCCMSHAKTPLGLHRGFLAWDYQTDSSSRGGAWHWRPTITEKKEPGPPDTATATLRGTNEAPPVPLVHVSRLALPAVSAV